MRAKFLTGLGAIALGTTVLTSCSSGQATDPNATVAAAADVSSCDPAATTLNVTFGQQGAEAMEIAVAKLKADHPGLTVNADPQPATSYDDLTKTIVSDIAVGKRPDLIMSGLGQLRFWVDTYSPAEIDTTKLPATYQTQFLGAGTVGDDVYLAPAQISAPVLLVNQSMLDAAGAGSAGDITTFDDLVTAATKVSSHTGEPSVSIPTQGLPDWFGQAFVQGSGGTFVNADGSAGFGDATGQEALGIWSTLKEEGLELGVVGDQDAMAQFVGGGAAFLVYTTSGIASLQKQIGDSFDWTPVDLPSIDGQGGALPAGGNGWIVLSEDACRAAFSNELVGDLLGKDAVLGASGTSYSYIPVDTDAATELLASDAATEQLTYAWSYDHDLTPWGGFDGSKTVQVNDAIRTMSQALQSGAPTGATVEAGVATVNSIVGK